MQRSLLRQLAETIAAFGLVASSVIAVAPLPAVAVTAAESAPTLTVDRNFVTGLSNPWDVGFLVDGTMFFTQRTGDISVRLADGTVRLLERVSDVVPANVWGEGGLLGLAVDPSFATTPRIYACFSSNISGNNDVRVARWEVTPDLDKLENRADIVTGIPYTTGSHSGCRPRFGPDGYLYVGTGDAVTGTNPQSATSLGGKVLRVDTDGAAAPDNTPPTGFDARIYNYGHRNIQGIAFRPSDSLGISVEHGPTVDDEVNELVNGANFGWDPVPGYDQTVPMTDTTKFLDAIDALWRSGSSTIAPSGATFLSGAQWEAWDGALAMAILKGQHLRILFIDESATLTGETIADLGADVPRLRSAVQGPDGNLYLTTDVRGGPGAIWKVTPGDTVPGAPTSVSATPGDAQASVSFAVPSIDGASPITGYTATCGSQSSTGPTSPLVVTGLTNEVQVQCTVVASNSVGSSPPSSPPVAVTPTATPPQIVPASTTVTEGNGGDRVAQVPVNLSAASTNTVTASWTSVNHDATAPADFTASSGTVTFSPGETARVVPVTIKGDVIDEAEETVVVRFSNPQNATLGGFGGLGAVKITDDDPLPQIVPEGASITEGNSGTKVVQVPVALSTPSGRTVRANWTTNNDQATAPSDFVAKSGTVSFAPGQMSKTVAVTIKGDTVREPNERFFVAFSSPTNATIGGIYGLGFVSIKNND